MQLHIITGMGGSGVSTVAHGLATAGAGQGQRLLLLDLSDGPPPWQPYPAVRRPDLDRELARLPALARWLAETGVRVNGAASLSAALPGIGEVLALATLHQALRASGYQVIVVDAPPLPAALRLLTLPLLAQRLEWRQRDGDSRWGRLLARHLIGARLPPTAAVDELEHLAAQLGSLAALLFDPTHTALSAVLRAGAGVREQLGPPALAGLPLAAVYAAVTQSLEHEEAQRLAEEVQPYSLQRGLTWPPAVDAGRSAAVTGAARLVSSERGAALELPLPFQRRELLSLRQTGDRIDITGPASAREVRLPPALAGHRCTGATYDGHTLTLHFSDTSDLSD